MRYVFLKEPYGIICNDNTVSIYNYYSEKIEKIFKLNENVKSNLLNKLDMYKILDFKTINSESTIIEKNIILRLIKENKFITVNDVITYSEKENEFLMFQAEKISKYYANSNPITSKYEIFKNLKNIIKNTIVIIYGVGKIQETLLSELKKISWKKIYVIKNKIDNFKNVLFYNDNKNIVYLNDMKEILFDKKEEQYFVIYANEEEKSEKLFDFNSFMENEKISWSLLRVSDENLIIGPTIFPGESGCLKCNCNIEEFENNNGIMDYEAKIMVGIFMSDICKIIGDMPEAIVEDISVTINRSFIINRNDLNGNSKDFANNLHFRNCNKEEEKCIQSN